MARKSEKMCIVCGNVFKGTAKAKVCTKNSNCRVQLKRLLDKGQKPPFELLAKAPIINGVHFITGEPDGKKLSAVAAKIVDKMDSNIPPIPVRFEGEDVFDFAARKSEWKLKYNQK